MSPRRFRKKKRLPYVEEDDNEPAQEATPYTSKSIRMGVVNPGKFVAWGSLGNLEADQVKPSSGKQPVWELHDRFAFDSASGTLDVIDDAENEDEEQDFMLRRIYSDDMLWMMRTQMKHAKQEKEEQLMVKKKEKMEWDASTFKLTSLEGRREAELIRLLFVVAGQPYEDERITTEDWEEMKSSTPYQSLPILSRCGQKWGNTCAMVRMLASTFLLLGETNDEHLIVEATYERLIRLQRQHSRAVNWVIKGEKNREKLEWAQSQLLHVVLPPAMKEWDQQILKSKGPFIVSTLTLADLAIFDFLDQCSARLVLNVLLDDYLGVSDLLMVIRNDPRIYGYLTERTDG